MKDYISIIIAFHEGKPPKTIRIKKLYLKVALTILISSIFLSIASYYLSLKLFSEKAKLAMKSEELKREKVALLSEKHALERERELLNQRVEEFEKELTEKVGEFEKKLTEVESYLAKRGVLEGKIAVGGASYKNTPKDISYMEFLNRRADQLLSAIRGIPLGYPVYGKITSHMGWRKNPFGGGYEFHAGIDIYAPHGTPVVATADGVVKLAGYYGDYGKAVVISHQSGYSTLYAHLSEIKVKVGERVKAGQVIGSVGSTGRSTGPHLHYEVLYDGKIKNPINYLSWR